MFSCMPLSNRLTFCISGRIHLASQCANRWPATEQSPGHMTLTRTSNQSDLKKWIPCWKWNPCPSGGRTLLQMARCLQLPWQVTWPMRPSHHARHCCKNIPDSTESYELIHGSWLSCRDADRVMVKTRSSARSNQGQMHCDDSWIETTVATHWLSCTADCTTQHSSVYTALDGVPTLSCYVKWDESMVLFEFRLVVVLAFFKTVYTLSTLARDSKNGIRSSSSVSDMSSNQEATGTCKCKVGISKNQETGKGDAITSAAPEKVWLPPRGSHVKCYCRERR